MSIAVLPKEINQQLSQQTKSNPKTSVVESVALITNDNSIKINDADDVLKEIAIKTKPDLDNYLKGSVEDKTPKSNNIPTHQADTAEIIQGVFKNSVATSELQNGIHYLGLPKNDILAIIAPEINTNPKKLANKVGSTDALQATYNHAMRSVGTASVLIGLGGLMRLITGISNGYNGYHHNQQIINTTQKKISLLQDFDNISNNKPHFHKNEVPLKTIKKLQDITETEIKNKANFEKKQKINHHINQTADIMSSVGNLVTVKNMLHSLTTKNAITQAVTAFNNGAVASAQTVAALKIGIGLMAVGMTISSVSTLLNIIQKPSKPTDKKDEIHSNITTKEKIQKKQQKNNQIIQESLIQATSNLSNGIGTAVLLSSPQGFNIAKILKWNHDIMFNKIFAWSNVTLGLIGGITAINTALKKHNENNYLNQTSKNSLDNA